MKKQNINDLLNQLTERLKLILGVDIDVVLNKTLTPNKFMLNNVNISISGNYYCFSGDIMVVGTDDNIPLLTELTEDKEGGWEASETYSFNFGDEYATRSIRFNELKIERNIQELKEYRIEG